MKTVVINHYNQLDQIHIEDRILPNLKDHEVKVKVHAASLNKADLFLALGKPFMIKLVYGLRKPRKRYPGSDFAGEVIEVGKQVKDFKIGDKVFGDLSGAGFGAFAETLIAPASKIWLLPEGFDYLQASTLPMAFGTALQAFKKAGNIKDKHVLIYGASGGVGRYLVQLAINYGAKVDSVSSKKHLKDLESFKIENMFDYNDKHFSLPINKYDVIFAVNGYQPSKVYVKSLVKNGTCIIIGGSGKQIASAMFKGRLYRGFKKRNFISIMAKTGQDVLKEIFKVTQEIPIDTQIGHVYPLSNAKDAYIDFKNHKHVGKYVINIFNEHTK